jgi:hypothetical protein
VNEQEVLGHCRHLLNDAKRILEGKGEIIATFYIATVKDNQMAIGELPVGQWNNKDLWKKAFRAAVKALDAKAAFFMSEAWMSKLKPEEGEKYQKSGNFPLPSQDPNRIEIIIIYGKAYTGAQAGIMLEFTKGGWRNKEVSYGEEIVYLGSEAERSISNRYFDGLWDV